MRKVKAVVQFDVDKAGSRYADCFAALSSNDGLDTIAYRSRIEDMNGVKDIYHPYSTIELEELRHINCNSFYLELIYGED